MKKYSKGQIDKALLLLEEAAQDKKEELLKHIDGKYVSIKQLFAGNHKGSGGDRIRHTVKDAIEHGEDAIKEKIHQGEDLYHNIDKKLRKKVKEANKRVCDNPYSYILGVGLVSAALGYIVSHHHSKGNL